MTQQAGDRTLSTLSDASQRIEGSEARSMNLQAARAIGVAVRTTLGPRGMDKMLVDDTGGVVVTNDGVTILEEMKVEHPAAEMVIEVARTQEAIVGDGTTSAAVLTSGLLATAADLLEQDIHPTTIAAGFERAGELAGAILDDITVPLARHDEEMLASLAETAMTGKAVESARGHLVDLTVRAAQTATQADGTVDRDAISIHRFDGGSPGDSRFVEGVLIDKAPVDDAMATTVEDADVFLYEGGIEAPEMETNTETTVADFDQAVAFGGRESEAVAEQVEQVVETGADVLLTAEGIDDTAQTMLAEAGVTALRRLDDDERRRIATATGATPVTELEAATTADLGTAGTVRQERIRMPHWRGAARPESTLVFEDVPGDDAGAILLRGGTEHALDEIERALSDALDVLTAGIGDGAVLPGAGATEIELSLGVARAADGVSGREQLAVEAFADAVQGPPRVLAENAGHTPIDAIIELRRRHDDGERTVGIDAETGEPIDALAAGVIEPRRVRETAIAAAVEAATMILRIDDVITAGELSTGTDEDGI